MQRSVRMKNSRLFLAWIVAILGIAYLGASEYGFHPSSQRAHLLMVIGIFLSASVLAASSLRSAYSLVGVVWMVLCGVITVFYATEFAKYTP